MRDKELCPKHGIKMVKFCPACRGSRGGKVGSASQAQARLKGAAARRKYPPCPRYGSHHFSPKTGRCPCGYTRPA